MVITLLAMTMMIGVAAIALDLGSAFQKHHQVQVAADAAALAAANCLAHPNTGPSPQCTSSTDTTDAAKVAQSYSASDGVQIQTSQVNISTTNHSVQVTPSNTGSTLFAQLFGMSSISESASATAGWSTGSTSCTTAGSSCAAVFAMGSSCSNTSSDPGGSPIIFNGSNDTIQGMVHSNGSIYEAGGGGQTLGATTFGNGSGCQIAWSNETGDTWGGSSTRPTTGSPPITSWPLDYSTVATACGTGFSYACTGPGGTPSYCTQAAASYTFGSGGNSGSQGQTQNQVWCAYGTGTPSNPATWNGLIYFQYSSQSDVGNWIGGTIEFGQNGWTLNPQLTNFPVLYATGSGNCSSPSSGGVCMSGGTQTINGSIFVPNGWIQFNGAGNTTSNFLEAQYINFIGGNYKILGTGPTSLSGGSGSGSDSLTG